MEGRGPGVTGATAWLEPGYGKKEGRGQDGPCRDWALVRSSSRHAEFSECVGQSGGLAPRAGAAGLELSTERSSATVALPHPEAPALWAPGPHLRHRGPGAFAASALFATLPSLLCTFLLESSVHPLHGSLPDHRLGQGTVHCPLCTCPSDSLENVMKHSVALCKVHLPR